MLLTIDVGNTHTVLGVFSGEACTHSWRLSTSGEKTRDEYAILLRHLLGPAGLAPDHFRGAIIACVVPPLQDTLRETCNSIFGFEPLLVGPGIRTGISLAVDHPQEVGADRIVNSVAAFHEFGGPVIVVDFGTATTFDPVSAEGAFLGGAIAPGVGISAEALYRHAAKLPRVELRKPRSVIGKNTIDNIQSGLFYGYLGLVDGILAGMKGELGSETRVIATGGLGGLFSGESRHITHYDPQLTLKGLNLLYRRNQR